MNNIAAIDLGTNSCRLIIADKTGNYILRKTTSTRLGEGLHSNMCFSPEAIQRGLECFKDFKQEIDKHLVKKSRIIATAGCRMAKNAPEFIDLVKQETGLKIEVIDGQEEARLNLLGSITHVLEKTPYALVFDIGGGSTEITLAKNKKNPQILHSISIPWGARNSAEAFDLIEYCPNKAQKLSQEISTSIAGFIKDSEFEKYHDSTSFIATSSTPLRLSAIIKNTGKYNREEQDGFQLKQKDIDIAINNLYKMKQIEMQNSPYIGEKRSYIFIASTIIFNTILKDLNIQNLTASLQSANDAIVKELIENGKKQQICQCVGRQTRT